MGCLFVIKPEFPGHHCGVSLSLHKLERTPGSGNSLVWDSKPRLGCPFSAVEKTLSLRGNGPGSPQCLDPRGISWRSFLPSPAKSPKSLWQRNARKGVALPASSWRALQTRASLGFPKPAELLECCCLIPVSSRECGGAGSCKVQTQTSPDFGDLGIMGLPGAALQALSSLPRMDFGQMLRKRCSLTLLENQE